MNKLCLKCDKPVVVITKEIKLPQGGSHIGLYCGLCGRWLMWCSKVDRNRIMSDRAAGPEFDEQLVDDGFDEEPIRKRHVSVSAHNYQQLAERTSSTASFSGRHAALHRLETDMRVVRLLHGAMGLCTESGELQDQLKKHLFYGKPLDLVNVAEECGDVFWYLAETLTAIDARFIDVMQKNIDKLRARYPDKFTEDKAINRDLDAERSVLEK